jgi:electron transport complex protein RnfC
LEDYTKFKLKRKEELAPLLEYKDNLFVVACNKCFKEFETVDEPECSKFEQMADEQGKTLIGCAKVDFLCNKSTTAKKLQSILPAEAENVFVISCGLGIQTVADLAEKPVYAAADSIAYRAHHGMALTKINCDACGQCYLNITGGICPIVDCSKSLTNGQCGGAKNGKCEVDKNKDCAWQKIYEKMEKQGRVSELLNQPTQIRDYSKVNYKVISEYVKSVRENRFEGYYGGIHPSERKELAEHLSLAYFPEVHTVVIPLSMHAGAPAEPIVEVG